MIPVTGQNYTISVTKNNNHINQNTKELSILVSMYGLSFMIRNTHQKKFFEYSISHANPLVLKEKLLKIIDERPVLNDNYDQIKLIFHNRLNALIPQEFFKVDIAKEQLSQQIKLLPNDTVNYDFISSLDAYDVYVSYQDFNRLVATQTQNLIIKHSATDFFEKIASLKNQIQDLPVFEVFLNIFPGDFQIAIFKNEKLQAFNHFEYENTDEFLYYLFFMLETLEVKPQQSRLYFFGIDEQNELLDEVRLFNDKLMLVPGLNPSQIYNHF